MHVQQGIQTTFVFSFSKNVFYPNQTFLCLDLSLFFLRGFDYVLKRAFLNFLIHKYHQCTIFCKKLRSSLAFSRFPVLKFA